MNLKSSFYVLLIALAVFVTAPLWVTHAQEVADQVILTTLAKGPKAKGAGVQQVGEVSTLSAAVAAATLTQVVAAPTAGSIYLRGIWINKAATTTGSILLRDGTGTNCASGTTHTILSLTAATGQTFKLGYQRIGIQVPAARALCAITEGANTSVQVLAQ